jgi:hypothetical protein
VLLLKTGRAVGVTNAWRVNAVVDVARPILSDETILAVIDNAVGPISVAVVMQSLSQ